MDQPPKRMSLVKKVVLGTLALVVLAHVAGAVVSHVSGGAHF